MKFTISRKKLDSLRILIPLVFAVSSAYGLVYAVVQQNYRQNANDPQIQISQDVTAALESGQSPLGLNSASKVDIPKSLATFIIIFDKDGKTVASSALLDGKSPTPPIGVFDFVREGGKSNFGSLKKELIYRAAGGADEDRFTWEPKGGIRIAAVLKSYKVADQTGFVLVGRNMREVENREWVLQRNVALAWIFTVFGVVGLSFLFL